MSQREAHLVKEQEAKRKKEARRNKITKIIMDRFGSLREKTVHTEKVMLSDGIHFVCYHDCPHKMTDLECAKHIQLNLKNKGFDVKDIKLIESDIKSIREKNNNRGFCKCRIIDNSIHVKYCFCG